MVTNAEKEGAAIWAQKNDSRITRVGAFLRNTRIDELPQLWNVLRGDMSIVGPRPEVPYYVNFYDKKQRQVFEVKPGITDYASLKYFDENVLLGKSEDPEQTYIKEIMPAKLKLNLRYINKQSFKMDMKLIFGTIGKLFR